MPTELTAAAMARSPRETEQGEQRGGRQVPAEGQEGGQGEDGAIAAAGWEAESSHFSQHCVTDR